MLKLTDQTLKKKTETGEYTDAQTPGLTLVVRASTSAARPNALRRIWTFRFTLGGKRQKMGLGSYPAVDLKEAHRKARGAAALVAKGLDPRLARRPDPANLTFLQAAEAYLVDALPRFAGEKGKAGLRHALIVHARPFHDRPVVDIGVRDVAALLKSLGTRAQKTRGVLRGVFAHVAIDFEDRGLSLRNPVTPDGLKAANYIPARSNAHHPALDFAEAPAFMNALRAIPSTNSGQAPTTDARLLEFVILTVARAGAARAATFEQISGELWIVPAAQLKDRAHRTGAFRVPLAPRALAIVEEMRALRPNAPPSAPIFAGADDMTSDQAPAPHVSCPAMARSDLEEADFRSRF